MIKLNIRVINDDNKKQLIFHHQPTHFINWIKTKVKLANVNKIKCYNINQL